MYGHNNATIRTTEEGEQVGPKMHAAVRACESRVWASENKLAQAVGPNGSSQYGYRIVNRCLSKGLLTIDPDHDEATPNGKGAVTITAKGERYLANHD